MRKLLLSIITSTFLLPHARAAAPLHDSFESPAVLSGMSAVVTNNNAEAITQIGEPFFVVRSLWWRWTAPAAGRLTIDTVGSPLDTAIAVFTGSTLDRLSCVAANNDTATGYTARVSFQVGAGMTFAISAGSAPPPSQSYGNVILRLNLATNSDFPPVVGEDNFNRRGELTGTQSLGLASTLMAGVQVSEPPAGKSGSVWWKWTAPVTGPVTIDTHGSDFPTLLSTYTGDDIARLQLVHSSDHAMGETLSQVSFSAQAHRTYQLRVRTSENFLTPGGNVVLNLYQQAGPDDDLHSYTAVEVELYGRTGRHYQLQKSPNFIVWENVGTPFYGSNSFVRWLFPVRGYDREFYRTRVLLP